MGKMYYSWADFERDINVIKDKVDLKKYKTIIGISKGGLPLAVKIANVAGLPLKIVEAGSYINGQKYTLSVEQFNCMPWRGPILLVDDISDSGHTLDHVKDVLEIHGKKVDVLTLFYKGKSIVEPTFWVHKIDDIWVNFCWE